MQRLNPIANPIALSIVATIGLVAGFSQAASAQQANVAQPQQIFNDQQNRDPFSSRGSDQSGGVMDLVHRAIQAGSLSSEDFQNQQQENLDSATAGFRGGTAKAIEWFATDTCDRSQDKRSRKLGVRLRLFLTSARR